MLIHGAAAEAWHLEIRHDRVERVVPVAQALHGLESILDGDHLMAFTLEQQHHRLPVHGVVVYDEDAHPRQILGGRGVRRLRAQQAAGQGDDHLGTRAAAARPQAQAPTRRLREGTRERKLDLATTA